MPEEIKYNRRRFLGLATMGVAGAGLGMVRRIPILVLMPGNSQANMSTGTSTVALGTIFLRKRRRLSPKL